MSRIGWKRHHGSLALAALLALLVPVGLGCAGEDDDVGGERQGAQGSRQPGTDKSARVGGNQGGQGGDRGGSQGGNTGGEAGGNQGGSTGGGQGGEQGELPAFQSDAEIAWVLRTFNMSEIEYSQAACRGAESPEVKAFAERMITEHLAAIDREGQLFQQHRISPASSARGQAFAGDMDGLFQNLGNMQGAELDEAYMAGQVRIHLALLDLIDTQLLSVVQNEALRSEIEALRAATLQHLAQAEQIYCSLTMEPGQGQGQGQGQGTQPMVRNLPLEERPSFPQPGATNY